MSSESEQLLQTLQTRLTAVVGSLRNAGPNKKIGIIVPDITDYVEVYIAALKRMCPEATIVSRTTGPFEKTLMLEIKLSPIISIN